MIHNHVLWCDSGFKIIPITPQSKIDQALRLVDSALSGKIAWCYADVFKYPLVEGNWIRREIKRLKTERMNTETTQLDCQMITIELAKLRKVEREFYLFDETTARTLRSNFSKLKLALELLCDEGEVEKYTITARGALKVEFWTEVETTYIRTIYLGATWGIVHSGGKQIVVESHNMGFQPLRKDEIVGQGRIDKGSVTQRIDKGSGEYNPYSDSYKDKVVHNPSLPTYRLNSKGK